MEGCVMCAKIAAGAPTFCAILEEAFDHLIQSFDPVSCIPCVLGVLASAEEPTQPPAPTVALEFGLGRKPLKNKYKANVI